MISPTATVPAAAAPATPAPVGHGNGAHGSVTSGEARRNQAKAAGTAAHNKHKVQAPRFVWIATAVALVIIFLATFTNFFDQWFPGASTPAAVGGEGVNFTDEEVAAAAANGRRLAAATPPAAQQTLTCSGATVDIAVGATPVVFNPGGTCTWDMWHPAGCIYVQRAANTGDTQAYGPYCPEGHEGGTKNPAPSRTESVWAADGQTFTVSYQLRPN